MRFSAYASTRKSPKHFHPFPLLLGYQTGPSPFNCRWWQSFSCLRWYSCFAPNLPANPINELPVIKQHVAYRLSATPLNFKFGPQSRTTHSSRRPVRTHYRPNPQAEIVFERLSSWFDGRWLACWTCVRSSLLTPDSAIRQFLLKPFHAFVGDLRKFEI